MAARVMATKVGKYKKGGAKKAFKRWFKEKMER